MQIRAVVMTAITFVLIGAGLEFAGPATAAPPPPSGPVITTGNLDNGGRPCTSATKPRLILGAIANQLEALGTDATPTEMPGAQYTFAIWPTGDPAAETDIGVTTYSSDALARATVPAGVESSGGTYAWRAQMTDSNGTSPWSTTCVFSYDGDSPPAPTISSPNFPPSGEGAGPVGQLAQFTFSGVGNPDIAGFLYGWGQNLPVPGCSYSGPAGQLVCPDQLAQPDVVRANAPGGTATVALNPPSDGPQLLSVEAMDAAGNVSRPPVTYQIFVPPSFPTVTQLSPAPTCGSQIQFSFAPHEGVTGVRAYWYSVGSAPASKVIANSAGIARATIPVTAQSYSLRVSSVSANGFTSGQSFQSLDINPQPSVSASVYVNSGQPVGGVGVSDTFTFTPPFDGISVSSYQYKFSLGPSGTVPADPNQQSGSVTWAPTRSGPQTLTVSAVNADGSGTSCPLTYAFTVAGGHHY